ncbi:GNAT family N-acetyltransferase [Xenorhabdus sp. Vera]|uniref:GNAT family N-acetyltransferase n=1 Tax=Xenorhabdus koppenhoeferi TaxID=351659 RepID=UPI0019BD45C9|nr:GNAT family N-acetyltransferase [Xenorhabdus sp. Vera]MBD2810754.1 GNAT family N-acetyltransferase [Xenorhabdus sp. Vera]
MLKRTYSYNGNTLETSSSQLRRTQSNRNISPDEQLGTEFFYNNPALFNRYMPIIKEVNKQEMENASNQILSSLNNDGWFFDVPERRIAETEQEKKEREHIGAWYERCSSTKENLDNMERHLEWMFDTRSYFHFVCYMNGHPIGVIMLRHVSDKIYHEPEVLYLITHLGIQNCAYLLVEKAVNKSYQLGSLGNLKVRVANDYLQKRVYSRFGFINIDQENMQLRPFERQQWIFYSHKREFRFSNNC